MYGGCILLWSTMAAEYPEMQDVRYRSRADSLRFPPNYPTSGNVDHGKPSQCRAMGRSYSRSGGSATAEKLQAGARIGCARKQTGRASLIESTGISLGFRGIMAVAMGAVVQWGGRVECGWRREDVGRCVVSIDLVLGEMVPSGGRDSERGEGRRRQRMAERAEDAGPSSIAHFRHGKRDQGAWRRPGTIRCTLSTAAIASHNSAPQDEQSHSHSITATPIYCVHQRRHRAASICLERSRVAMRDRLRHKDQSSRSRPSSVELESRKSGLRPLCPRPAHSVDGTAVHATRPNSSQPSQQAGGAQIRLGHGSQT